LKLPGVEQAIVDPAKIQDYLLSDIHPVGRFKAAFFRGIGYSPDSWERLRDDILEAARDSEAEELESSPYGTKYRVRCILSGSPGLSGPVDCVWLVTENDRPRFITAYPAGV
jgi:hypothetical protein